jgi:exopolyphosphatase/guanosine-5'-triphosphate,3'-diphosphate pyrophosphatase
MNEPQYVAAVDLGSNSFHLVLMKNENNRLVSVDCRRELVRLAAGVDAGRINHETRGRALRCLTHFGQLLKAYPDVAVSAVGTSAFRMLYQDQNFLRLAETALGQPIRILTGEDEALYIYRGVSQGQPDQKRFVLEFLDYDSLPQSQLNACMDFVDSQLATVSDRFKDLNWEDAMGSSGTIKAVSWAMHNLGIADEGVIKRKQLDRLLPVLTQAGNQQQLSHLLELNPRRIAVFAAGYIILHRIFHLFDIQQMRISNRAIREGIIDEMIAPPYTVD